MIRKITLGLAVLLSGFSANVLASPEQSPCNVTVPCYNGGLTFGLAGFYTRPTNDNLAYAVVYPLAENIDAVEEGLLKHGKVKSLSPDYDWGYRVSLGYIFPCSSYDVNVTYSNFNNTTKDNVVYHDAIVFGTTTPLVLTTADGDASDIRTHARVNFNYQALDVDFGQHYNIGCNTHVRLLAGVRFADVERKFNVDYDQLETDGDVTDNFIFRTTQKSEFKGVGPRFGTNVQYNLGNGFGVVGEATGSLLVGHLDSNFFERDLVIDADGDTVFDDFGSFHNPKHTKVVPNLTAKLGVNYNYELCNATRTKLSFEAGYQVDHYFNVAQSVTAVNAFDGAKQNSDISFNGPYVGFQVKI